jgi:tripartite-type tricarboxylate transporter receptor subunit TctC
VKEPADGYTLMLAGSNLWISPLLHAKESYNVLTDLAPVTMAASTPNVLVVHPSVPARSVQELISLAKARPGELNYAAIGIGGATHLAAELFKQMTNTNIVHVNYKGTAPALNDVIGGQVQLMFASSATVGSYVKSGKMRALGVTTTEPFALYPGVPTVASTVPGYEAKSIGGVFAPAKTPEPIVRQLNQEIVRILKSPDIQDKLFNAAVVVIGSSPEEFRDTIKSEISRMGKLIRDAKITDE